MIFNQNLPNSNITVQYVQYNFNSTNVAHYPAIHKPVMNALLNWCPKFKIMQFHILMTVFDSYYIIYISMCRSILGFIGCIFFYLNEFHILLYYIFAIKILLFNGFQKWVILSNLFSFSFRPQFFFLSFLYLNIYQIALSISFYL